MRFIPAATCSQCTDAKVAYGFDGSGKVRRQSRFGQNLPQTSLSVFNPKTLSLPAIRLKSIRQRKQATDGKIRRQKKRNGLQTKQNFDASSVRRSLFLLPEIHCRRNHRADGKLRSFKKITCLSADKRSGSRHLASSLYRIHDRVSCHPAGYRLSVPHYGSPEVPGGSLSAVPTLPCR